MLASTQHLLAYLESTPKPDYIIVRKYLDVIMKCGDRSDADCLLNLFLHNPQAYYYDSFLDVIELFCDASDAEKLSIRCTENQMLRADVPAELLRVLGRLKCEPAKPMLIRYAFGIGGETDHYLCLNAVLGLLPLDCDEYQELILQEIEKCYGKNFFHEFVPALVCKLKDRELVLAKLYETGRDYASTDCNAGIILGFSLCGAEGEAYFSSILFDPHWETYASGTGTVRYVYQGLNNLGISFKTLYERIKNIDNEKELSYSINVLLDLINCKIDDYSSQHIETFVELYQNLFQWKEGASGFMELARTCELGDKAYQVKRTIELKMSEEMLIDNINIY